MSRGYSRSFGAFTLIELLVVIAIVALLISILLPALASARRTAKAVVCQSNMRQMVLAYHLYATDHKDVLASFSRDGHASGVDYGDVQSHTGHSLAAEAQEYITQVTGRAANAEGIPTWNNYGSRAFVFEQYSYLVVLPYLGGTLPAPSIVCPEDRARLSWRTSPLDMESNASRPTKPINESNLNWWPYSSSYQTTPDAVIENPSSIYNQRNYYYQYTAHDAYGLIQTKLHNPYFHKLSEVHYPSQKVAINDTQDRHYAKQDTFFMFSTARQPLGFFDGSVSTRTTGDANLGVDPTIPSNSSSVSTLEYTIKYSPDLGFESQLPAYVKNAYVNPRYRWTRGGLGGIDFSGLNRQ